MGHYQAAEAGLLLRDWSRLILGRCQERWGQLLTFLGFQLAFLGFFVVTNEFWPSCAQLEFYFALLPFCSSCTGLPLPFPLALSQWAGAAADKRAATASAEGG
jgi:hypothetical protein